MKIGDIVQLKSGGPAMTVLGLSGADDLTCVWYAAQADEYRSQVFPKTALDLIQYDDDDDEDLDED